MVLEPLVARLLVDSSGTVDPLVRHACEENPVVQCTFSFQRFRGKFSGAVYPFVEGLLEESTGAAYPFVHMLFGGNLVVHLAL